MPVPNLERAVHPIRIKQSRTRLGQVDVPDVIGSFRQTNAIRQAFRIVEAEQTQFDGRGVFGKEREIRASSIPGGAKRIWLSWQCLHMITKCLKWSCSIIAGEAAALVYLLSQQHSSLISGAANSGALKIGRASCRERVEISVVA